MILCIAHVILGIAHVALGIAHVIMGIAHVILGIDHVMLDISEIGDTNSQVERIRDHDLYCYSIGNLHTAYCIMLYYILFSTILECLPVSTSLLR